MGYVTWEAQARRSDARHACRDASYQPPKRRLGRMLRVYEGHRLGRRAQTLTEGTDSDGWHRLGRMLRVYLGHTSRGVPPRVEGIPP